MAQPPIDFEHLKTYTAGDFAVEQEVLNLFVHQVEMWLRMLEDSGDEGSWRDAAHSLKGSARGIGAWTVAELCDRAEALADDATTAERSIVLGDIKNAISHVIAAIDEHLSEKSVA